MDIVSSWFVRRLIGRARPYLKAYGLLQTVKQKPALLWEPGGGKILVLAPHMDDEVIGCGGTLHKHISKGADVTVIYLTDGRYGSHAILRLTGEERKKQERRLIATRKEEARLALKTLGIKKSVFLDAEETRLTSSAGLQLKLRQLLDSIQPDAVYLPFFFEEPPDHLATNQLLLDATINSGHRFDCFGYEVWTPLFSNCLVEISQVAALKKEALQHYKSQLEDKNYIHTCLGLNAYRSSALLDNQDGFVEAFFTAPLEDYRCIYDSVRVPETKKE
jgi:LmbE family N-acetylglucosaminyl deacetylase